MFEDVQGGNVQQDTAAPVETQSTETPVNAETEGTQETPAKPEGETEGKRNRFQERISDLVRQREEARKQAEWFRTELEKLRQPDQKPAQAEGKPVPASFNSYEDYLEALSDWKADQRISKFKSELQETESKKTEQQHAETVRSSFSSKVDAAREKYEDFDSVAFDESLPVTQFMTQAIVETDNGADILYHLGNNPKEAQRIASLSPIAQAREIGRLEMKLSQTPVKPKTSSAPAPINPVGKGSTTTSPENMSTEEWMKWREDQIKAKRKR